MLCLALNRVASTVESVAVIMNQFREENPRRWKQEKLHEKPVDSFCVITMRWQRE